MCKTIFIATHEPLTEIPFDETKPDFAIEKITGEFQPVTKKFLNQNIYIVRTSRGCGCDFGVTEIPDLGGYLENEKKHTYPIDKIAKKLRTILGSQEEWEKKHILEVRKQIDDEKSFVEQTQTLIDIIKDNVTPTLDVELFCCWAGDYESPLENTKYIATDDKEFFRLFDLELNEKVVFSRPKASS